MWLTAYIASSWCRRERSHRHRPQGGPPAPAAGHSSACAQSVSPNKPTGRRLVTMSVLEAAEAGTCRDLLVAMRDLIARTIDDGCAARDLVGLSMRLIDLGS